MLDVINEEDPLKGAPEPKVEGVGLSAGIVDYLKRGNL